MLFIVLNQVICQYNLKDRKPQLEIHELEAPSRGKIEKKELLHKLN